MWRKLSRLLQVVDGFRQLDARLVTVGELDTGILERAADRREAVKAGRSPEDRRKSTMCLKLSNEIQRRLALRDKPVPGPPELIPKPDDPDS